MSPRSLMRSLYSCSKCDHLLQHQFKEEYVSFATMISQSDVLMAHLTDTYYSAAFGTNADGQAYTGCTGDLGWAVACPAATIGLVLIFLLLKWLAAGIAVKVEFWLAAFLTIFWIAGAFVMTFRGPFLATGNGYFGAWGSLLAACLWAVDAGVVDAVKAFVPGAGGDSGSKDAKVAQKNDEAPAVAAKV
jgi:hypothetical protein